MRGDDQILMIALFHDHEDHWSGKQNSIFLFLFFFFIVFILEKSKKYKK